MCGSIHSAHLETRLSWELGSICFSINPFLLSPVKFPLFSKSTSWPRNYTPSIIQGQATVCQEPWGFKASMGGRYTLFQTGKVPGRPMPQARAQDPEVRNPAVLQLPGKSPMANTHVHSIPSAHWTPIRDTLEARSNCC